MNDPPLLSPRFLSLLFRFHYTFSVIATAPATAITTSKEDDEEEKEGGRGEGRRTRRRREEEEEGGGGEGGAGSKRRRREEEEEVVEEVEELLSPRSLARLRERDPEPSENPAPPSGDSEEAAVAVARDTCS